MKSLSLSLISISLSRLLREIHRFRIVIDLLRRASLNRRSRKRKEMRTKEVAISRSHRRKLSSSSIMASHTEELWLTKTKTKTSPTNHHLLQTQTRTEFNNPPSTCLPRARAPPDPNLSYRVAFDFGFWWLLVCLVSNSGKVSYFCYNVEQVTFNDLNAYYLLTGL